MTINEVTTEERSEVALDNYRGNTNADAAIEATREGSCCDPVVPAIMEEAVAKADSTTVDKIADMTVERPKNVPETPVMANRDNEKLTILLFKTPTCPNCKAAGAILDKAGVKYEPKNANEEKDLVMKFGIKQAPTLVLVHGDNFEKYRGVSDIKGWLMSTRK